MYMIPTDAVPVSRLAMHDHPAVTMGTIPLQHMRQVEAYLQEVRDRHPYNVAPAKDDLLSCH